VTFSVVGAEPSPGRGGRGLLIAILLALAVGSWLRWTMRPQRQDTVTADLFVLAGTGGWLCCASPSSAASLFAFVAVSIAGSRVETARAIPVLLLGALALGIGVLVYDRGALTFVAYTLGFAATLLAVSNGRQTVARAEQAELLLVQTQRSREEQLRAARLEESARIAREIHDVLAHSLAALVIQLEATGALVEQGATPESILARLERARALAREGLQETRQAVGALRGDATPVPERIEALLADFRSSTVASVELRIDGERSRLTGQLGQTVLRITQEALTNVRKHSPGAEVAVMLSAGRPSDQEVVLVIADRCGAAPDRELAGSGGGYGLRGMRERAQMLGGSLEAGPDGEGWRLELRLPVPEVQA
jgi:signal transduction histidine kinase